jgi:murein DD-endopeptidase MepM/ murein hydrolase activator NlpD
VGSRILAATALAALALAAPAASIGDAQLAAVQVALKRRGLYAGTIDGLPSEPTTVAVRRFQRRAGLVADGIAGPLTRAALHPQPAAALQFLVAWHGFPPNGLDGRLGPRTERALRRFQHWAGLEPSGVSDARTLAALASPPPACVGTLTTPVAAAIGDPFGPRGDRFHSGLDYLAGTGAPVRAAAPGRVTWAGELAGGWGLLVTVAHASGLRTMYAHLGRIDVAVGDRVTTGDRLGLVGATGHAIGPHLHFEARLRGAAVDPLPCLR